MKLNLGIDLIEIDRIKRSLKNPRFLKRIYTEEEQLLFPDHIESLAAHFAAKEAFAKALGTGFRGFFFHDISVLRNAAGAPFFSFSNRAAEKMAGKSVSLSLTHSKTTAGAVVILYSEEEETP